MTQKPRSHITLVPFGGLGNRLKAISAGIKLARQTHSDIDIYWVCLLYTSPSPRDS